MHGGDASRRGSEMRRAPFSPEQENKIAPKKLMVMRTTIGSVANIAL